MLPRITVILYHRVTDDARDNLTVGTAQFDRQMSLLRQHCDVLPLRRARMPGDSALKRPLVAVTFDDGYLTTGRMVKSPCVTARPRRFSSRREQTGNRSAHNDVRRGNPTIATMMAALARDANLIHDRFASVSHIDCAREDEGVVVDELARSRDDLERELGILDPVFAYPYGGRQHMTAQRLDLVKAAGYAGCLSAYGGSNVGTVDRFNVLRLGIHWEFTDQTLPPASACDERHRRPLVST